MTKSVSVPSDLWDQIVAFIEGQMDTRDGADGWPLPNEAIYLSMRIDTEVKEQT